MMIENGVFSANINTTRKNVILFEGTLASIYQVSHWFVSLQPSVTLRLGII